MNALGFFKIRNAREWLACVSVEFTQLVVCFETPRVELHGLLESALNLVKLPALRACILLVRSCSSLDGPLTRTEHRSDQKGHWERKKPSPPHLTELKCKASSLFTFVTGFVLGCSHARHPAFWEARKLLGQFRIQQKFKSL